MIYLLSLLIGSSVFAGNFVPASKTHTKTYWEKSVCESQESDECVDATGCPLDECDIKTERGRPTVVVNESKRAQKLKEVADREADFVRRIKDRADRKARIEDECAKADGLLKELCDHVLDK